MKLSQVKEADIVISTHGHSDHIGDSYEICKRTKAKFVGNYELCSVAEAVHGLKMGSRALSMNSGGEVKVKDATITMVQAHHSQSLSPHVIGGELPEGLLFHPDSAVNGFVVAYNNGISIYDTSDTCLFSDMQLIGQMYGPQISDYAGGRAVHHGDPRGRAGGEPDSPRHRHSLSLRADYESAGRHRRVEPKRYNSSRRIQRWYRCSPGRRSPIRRVPIGLGAASRIDFQANGLNTVIRKSSYRSDRGKLPRPIIHHLGSDVF